MKFIKLTRPVSEPLKKDIYINFDLVSHMIPVTDGTRIVLLNTDNYLDVEEDIELIEWYLTQKGFYLSER